MPTRHRFSGALAIKVELLDASDPEGRAVYACTVHPAGTPKGTRWHGVVRSPAFRAYADDAPVAFSKTAQAALSFAEHEGFPVESYAEPHETEGYAVTAKRRA